MSGHHHGGFVLRRASSGRMGELPATLGDFYQSGAWRRRRAAQLGREPLCRRWGARATHADHVIPVAAGGDFDTGPLQSLCARCHRQKTARESRG